MWYKIEYTKLGILYLPTFLRRLNNLAFVQAFIRPIDSLYYLWSNWRTENIYKLEHTGQVCSLRGSLNDKFDPLYRRIYITDGQEHDVFYIFTEAEQQDVWMHTEAENDVIWLYTEAETADSGLDFIVYVPQEIFNSQIEGLHAHIKIYKQGGRRYKIMIIQ